MATNNTASTNNTEWYANQQARQTKKDDSWAKMLQMMAMSQKMTDQQMIGFALGKLLRDGWLNYKDKREWNRTHGLSKQSQKDAQSYIDTMSQRLSPYLNPAPSASVAPENYAASLPSVEDAASSSSLSEYANGLPMNIQTPPLLSPETEAEIRQKIYGGAM